MKSETIKALKDLFDTLPPRRYRDLSLLVAFSVVQGLMDILLVALLARLVGLIAGAQLTDQLPGVQIFGGDLLDQAGWLILIIVVTFWLTSLTRFLVSLRQSMLSAEIWGDVVNQAYENLIFQDYEYFLKNQSSDLVTTFNRMLAKVSNAVIAPLLSVFSNFISVFVLFVGIIYVLGGSSIVMFSMMLGAYILSSRLVSPYIKFATRQQLRYSKNINALLIESLGSIRDVQLYSSHKFFIDRFSEDGVIAKRYDRLIKLLPDIPRYIIEPAGVTILFAVGLGAAMFSGEIDEVKQAIPFLTAIMGTLLRVVGPLTNTFREVNKLRGGIPEISNVLKILRLRPAKKYLNSFTIKTTSKGVSPRFSIKLDNVSFMYEKTGQFILKDMNLSIPVGARVALVGSTGSGKTTIAHLLLGLLSPTSGSLLLDGVELADNEVPSWQNNCALVPQDIKLINSSIKDNVAFGCDPDAISDDEIWIALKAACLVDVVNQMPYGLYTIVGENGINLSGGQRQRLSLARAFFRRASFLVLDEATSALDNNTEKELMQALDSVGRYCTTVIIAHRLVTIRDCDFIYELEDGAIKAFGSFDSLCRSSDSFRKMAQIEFE